MNKARQELCKSFISTLKKGDIPWESVFKNDTCHKNALTKMDYLGLNNLILTNESNKKGYKSNLWITKSQAQTKKWELKENAQPVLLEMVVMEEKEKPEKQITIYPYLKEVLENASNGLKYQRKIKVFNVYNLEQFKNVPKSYFTNETETEKQYNPKFIENLPKKLGIFITSDLAKIKRIWPDLEIPNEITAFYLEETNIIYAPERKEFNSEYDYNAIRLHEMCHSTADKNRLDRSYLRAENTGFGSPGYAREELRAEIASVFLMQDIGIKANKDKLTNHKAYIQSWIRVLENNPNELNVAIDESFRIEEYILKIGEYSKYYDSKEKTA